MSIPISCARSPVHTINKQATLLILFATTRKVHTHRATPDFAASCACSLLPERTERKILIAVIRKYIKNMKIQGLSHQVEGHVSLDQADTSKFQSMFIGVTLLSSQQSSLDDRLILRLGKDNFEQGRTAGTASQECRHSSRMIYANTNLQPAGFKNSSSCALSTANPNFLLFPKRAALHFKCAMKAAGLSLQSSLLPEDGRIAYYQVIREKYLQR